MLISVKLLTKYVIIIYALGSVHENFGQPRPEGAFPVFPGFGAREKRSGDEVEVRCLNQTRCKVAEKANFLAGLGEKNG